MMSLNQTPPLKKIRLGILVSGRGSNLKAIFQAIESGELSQVEIATVISNRPSAQGLLYAEEKGLNTTVFRPKLFPHREAYDQALLDYLKQQGIDLVILAGYSRIITPVLIQAFPQRILNIHPSLLPAYGGKGMLGMAVHEAVIAAGEKESGCTVHVVTEDVDAGPILGQRYVPVQPDDTSERLAEKVLAQEHSLYPEIISRVAAALLNQPKGVTVQ